MLVSRLDDKAYGNILKLIKVDSIDEFEIPGIEDFPTERSSRRKKDEPKAADAAEAEATTADDAADPGAEAAQSEIAPGEFDGDAGNLSRLRQSWP